MICNSGWKYDRYVLIIKMCILVELMKYIDTPKPCHRIVTKFFTCNILVHYTRMQIRMRRRIGTVQAIWFWCKVTYIFCNNIYSWNLIKVGTLTSCQFIRWKTVILITIIKLFIIPPILFLKLIFIDIFEKNNQILRGYIFRLLVYLCMISYKMVV